MEKGILVKDIIAGKQINGIFAIKTSTAGKTHKGDPFWTLMLCDATGSIEGKIWIPLSARFTEFENGSYVKIMGIATRFNDKCQVKIEKLDILDDSQKSNLLQQDFMPASPFSIPEMYSQLLAIIEEQFTHKPWRDLIFSVLQDKNIREAFCMAPAATGIHHAYVGGLLEHTLSVAKLCIKIASLYTELDKQTLLAGAILHDIGKIRELTSDISMEYTQEGRLLGHIFLGLAIMEPFLNASSLEPCLKEHLQHLILSHHGQLEFGSPKLPQTAEAITLHYADNIDAKIAQCRALFSDQTERPAWSSWQSTLSRPILLPTATPASAGSANTQCCEQNYIEEDWLWEKEESEPTPEELAEIYADPAFNGMTEIKAAPASLSENRIKETSSPGSSNKQDKQCSLL